MVVQITGMALLAAMALYFLAMMISFAKTGKPDPEEKFRLLWWKEDE